MKLLLFMAAALLSAAAVPEIILQSGHGANISALEFAPNGQFLVSASEDSTLRLWDARTGAQLKTLRGHTNIVTSLAISRDSTLIASASLDHTLRVWSAATGQQIAAFRGTGPTAYLLKMTPDASSLITAETVAAGTILRYWDIKTGRPIRTIERHDAAVSYLFFRGNNLVVADESGEDESSGAVTVYDAATGRPLESKTMLLCGASNDSAWIAVDQSDEKDRKADIVDPIHNKRVSGIKGQVSRIVFSPGGDWLAYESASGDSAIVQRTTGGSSRAIRGRGAEFSMLALSNDGQLLATAGADYTVHIWDTASGKLAHAMAGQSTPNALALSSDGRTLAAAAGDLQLWDVVERAQIAGPRYRGASAIAFSRDGALLAVSSDSLDIVDRKTNSLLRRLKCAAGTAMSPVFSANGKWIAANCASAVQVWSLADGREAARFGASTAAPAFHGQGGLLAASTATGLAVYDVLTSRAVTSIQTPEPVTAIAFGGAGDWMAFGTKTGVFVVDLHTKKKLWSEPVATPVANLQFAKEGRELLVLLSALWRYEAANGHPLGALLAKVPNPQTAEFSANGEYLAAGSSSGSIVWQLKK